MKTKRIGMTLIELLVVVGILVAMAGFVLPLLGGTVEKSSTDATLVSLTTVRDTIMGKGPLPGYFGDMQQLPQTIGNLYQNPNPNPNPAVRVFDCNTCKGWHGPYLQNQTGTYIINTLNTSNGFTTLYGADNDPAVIDAWGHPLVIQYPTVGTPAQQAQFARLVSAGADGKINTRADALYPSPTTDTSNSDRGDDVIIFLKRSDVPPTTAELEL
jgi:type II secretory pathway pseudopilin PulG